MCEYLNWASFPKDLCLFRIPYYSITAKEWRKKDSRDRTTVTRYGVNPKGIRHEINSN